MRVYQRPVFLRLEFGHDDMLDEYLSVWKKFAERRQAGGSLNIALVWESASCEESNPADWYPGDEVVDWVGMSYCDGKPSEATIQFAREHFKPVMMNASSNSMDWNEWFVPFFQFVKENNDVIRAVTYLNAGKSRIDLNADLLQKWKEETKESFWLKASPKLFNELGFVE